MATDTEMNSPRSESVAKRILVYRNGDSFFGAHPLVVNKRACKTYEALLHDVTNTCKLPRFCRCLYTPRNGHRVTGLDQLESNKAYVAASGEKFKKIGYTEISQDPLHKRGVRRLVREIKPVEHSNIHASARFKKIMQLSPLTIFVYLNGEFLRPASRILLTPRLLNMHSIDAIYDTVQDRVLTGRGAVAKLHTLDGTPIKSAAELKNLEYYVALGKNETFINCGYGRPREPLKLSPRLERRDQSLYSKSSNRSNFRARRFKKGGDIKKEADDPFYSKPVTHKRSGEAKKREVNYDNEDDIFRASSREKEVAAEVQETRDTKVDLPVDQVEAEEVKDEYGYDDKDLRHLEYGETDEEYEQYPEEFENMDLSKSKPIHPDYEIDDKYSTSINKKIISSKQRTSAGSRTGSKKSVGRDSVQNIGSDSGSLEQDTATQMSPRDEETRKLSLPAIKIEDERPRYNFNEEEEDVFSPRSGEYEFEQEDNNYNFGATSKRRQSTVNQYQAQPFALPGSAIEEETDKQVAAADSRANNYTADLFGSPAGIKNTAPKTYNDDDDIFGDGGKTVAAKTDDFKQYDDDLFGDSGKTVAAKADDFKKYDDDLFGDDNAYSYGDRKKEDEGPGNDQSVDDNNALTKQPSDAQGDGKKADDEEKESQKDDNDNEEDKKRNDAACTIQKNVRGYQARKTYQGTKKKKKDTKSKPGSQIQSTSRGKVDKKNVKQKKQKRHDAQTKIASNYRGYKTRKELAAKKDEPTEEGAS